MNEGLKPSLGSIRIEAIRAVDAIEAVRQDYIVRGYRLNQRPSEDTAVGAHVNLWLARNIAQATAPYHTLTRSELVLQDISPSSFVQVRPAIVAGASNEGAGEVNIYIPDKNKSQIPVTGRLVDEALDRERAIPELALLFIRFGRRTPGSLLDTASEKISRTIDRGRFKSVGFHIFGK